MQEKTSALIDLILDEDRMLINEVKKQLNNNNFNTVLESIFGISRNNEHAEMVCRTDDYFKCIDYLNDNYNDLHYELINALREKCK